MRQLDLFYDTESSKDLMNWPNGFDGAHSIGPVSFGTVHPLYGIGPVSFGTVHPLYGAVPPQKTKIFESPDKGKTVYERDFGASADTRRIIKSSVEQQWTITYKVDV